MVTKMVMLAEVLCLISLRHLAQDLEEGDRGTLNWVLSQTFSRNWRTFLCHPMHQSWVCPLFVNA